jgi:predicted PurR-regulated permease PerM
MKPGKPAPLEDPGCGSPVPAQTEDRSVEGEKNPDPKSSGFPGIAMSLLGILAAGVILKAGASFLIPLTVAFFLMLLFQPASTWIAVQIDRFFSRCRKRPCKEHAGHYSRLSDYLSVAFVILVFILLAWVLYTLVSGQVMLIMSKGDQIQSNITRPVEDWMVDSQLFGDSMTVHTHISHLKDSAVDLVPNAAVPIISLIFTFILILFITAFLLIGRSNLEERLRTVGHIERIESIVSKIEKNTRRFIEAKIICSFLTGMLVYALLDICYLDFQDALMWGMVYFVMDFIPFYGTLVAGLGTVLYTLAVYSPGTSLGAWPVIPCLIGINALVSNGIEPKIMQRSLPIGPVTVLFVVILWAWLWGAWGMILAVPLSIMLRVLLEEIKGRDYWLCILMEA